MVLPGTVVAQGWDPGVVVNLFISLYLYPSASSVIHRGVLKRSETTDCSLLFLSVKSPKNRIFFH